MNNKYSIQEGLESLDRIRLMMGYDMLKTLSEQVPGVENTTAPLMGNSGQSKKDEDEKNAFLTKNKIFKTPYSQLTDSDSIAIPKDSKILLWNSGDDRQKAIFGKWFGTGWQEYIPKEDFLKSILTDNTLRRFTTSDGITYMTYLERYTEKEPYYYRFVGYKDDKGNPYNQEKYVGKIPKLMEENWFRENAAIIAQIAASLVVGFLTGGQTLIFQAIAQLGVDLAFAIPYVQKGDYIGAYISVIMGLIPVAGRLTKFGVKPNISFLSKYGKALSEITEVDDLIKWYEKLGEPDKLLMTRVFKQTEGELKNITSKSLIKGFSDAVKNETIVLSKIPASQLLWWKQLFVEGGVSLTTGVGLQLANIIYQFNQTEEKIGSTKITQTKKSKQYQKHAEELKTKDPIKYQKTTIDSTLNNLGGEYQDPRELEW